MGFFCMASQFSWSEVLSNIDSEPVVVDLDTDLEQAKKTPAPSRPTFHVEPPKTMSGFVVPEPVEIRRTGLVENADLPDGSAGRPMKGNPFLGEMLVANRLIAQDELDRALECQKVTPAPLGR